MKVSKLLMLALPMLAITSLASCGMEINFGESSDHDGSEGTSGGQDSSEVAGDNVLNKDLSGTTVNFMVYQPSDQDSQNALTDLLAEFTEETGINVRLQATPKDSYDATFRSATTRGRYKPDLAYMDQPLIATYASDDLIYPLDGYIKNNGVDTTAYNTAAYETNIYRGHTYGLPLNVTASVLLYNKDLVTTVPTTWEEWLDVQVPSDKALFEGVGSAGYAGWYFQAFLENCGGTLYDAETNTVAFNSEEGIEAAQFLKDLYRLDTNDETIRSGANAFVNGDVLFKIGSSYDIDNIRKQSPNFNLGVALMPGKDGSTHYSCMGGENLVIPTSGENKDGAMRLLLFLSEKENMNLLGAFTGNFPAITEYQETEDALKATVLEQLEYVVPRPVVPGWMQVNDLYLGQAISDIVNYEEQADIATRLAWAEEASNQVLAAA